MPCLKLIKRNYRAVHARFTAGTYRLSDRIGIRAGYRILEGGADNDEVYNFSLFNYASVGITYTFKNTEE